MDFPPIPWPFRAFLRNEQAISESQIKHLTSALTVEEEEGQIVAYDEFLRLESPRFRTISHGSPI